MKELIQHEILEMELLELLKNNHFLKPLVFVGGTMLRLCHELPRYSVDLDFWVTKEIDLKTSHKEMKEFLAASSTLKDSENKFNTLLLCYDCGETVPQPM